MATNIKDYKVGQKVKTYDPDDKQWVRGEILEIKPTGITVKWEDLPEETFYTNEDCNEFQPN